MRGTMKSSIEKQESYTMEQFSVKNSPQGVAIRVNDGIVIGLEVLRRMSQVE